MAKYRAHITFFTLMLAYVVVRYIRDHFSNLPVFVSHHLTDLIFVPAMAVFALIFVRLIKGDNNLRIPAVYVFIQVILISFYFEWFLPRYSANAHWYTADIWDVPVYFLGGLLFLLIQRKL